MGAVCGLRQGIPVVEGGLSGSSPFGPWSVQVTPSGDIVETCDAVVGEKL
jgi:hypothetical protein